ncbi:MAG: PPOX class F420-dependent oxidoreductase [Chloroflexia bacterium]
MLSDELRDFLKEHRFAVLATINPDGTPQQSAVWYELRDDSIVMNTRAGRVKERNLLRDPRVSFCVVDGYRALTLVGSATLDYEPATSQATIRALAILNHGAEKGTKIADETYAKQKRLNIQMTIEKAIPYGF